MYLCAFCFISSQRVFISLSISLNPVAGDIPCIFRLPLFLTPPLHRGSHSAFLSLFCFPLQIRLLWTHQYAHGLKELLALHLRIWLCSFSIHHSLTSYSLWSQIKFTISQKKKKISDDEWLSDCMDQSQVLIPMYVKGKPMTHCPLRGAIEARLSK